MKQKNYLIFAVIFFVVTDIFPNDYEWMYHDEWDREVIFLHQEYYHPSTREWLYHVAQNDGFAYYEEVAENRGYYIHLMESHLAKLRYKLQHPQKYLSRKKLLRAGVCFVAAIFFGGLGYYTHTMCTKEISKGECLLLRLQEITAWLSMSALNMVGGRWIYKAYNYEPCVRRRYERDRRILKALKEAQKNPQITIK